MALKLTVSDDIVRLSCMYGRPYDIGQWQERAYSACTQDNAADVSHDDESARISSHVYRAAVEMGELNPKLWFSPNFRKVWLALSEYANIRVRI